MVTVIRTKEELVRFPITTRTFQEVEKEQARNSHFYAKTVAVLMNHH